MELGHGMKGIDEILHEIAHRLPSQGPIDVFIHHNTLHSFEDLPFEVAIQKASEVYGAKPYWKESRYQSEYEAGRITDKDLESVLERPGDAQQMFVPGVSNLMLRRLALTTTPQTGLRSQVEWELSEHHEKYAKEHEPLKAEKRRAQYARDNAFLRDGSHRTVLHDLQEQLKTMLGDTASTICEREFDKFYEILKDFSPSGMIRRSNHLLWIVCLYESAYSLTNKSLRNQPYNRNHRHFDSHSAISDVVNPYLIKLAASYLDQGLGRWHLSGRSKGFLHCLLRHLKDSFLVMPWWIKIPKTFSLEELHTRGSERIIEDELKRRGVPQAKWHDFLLQKALELRGWSGFMHLFESRLDLAPLEPESHRHTFADFLASKLLLEHFAEEKFGEKGYIEEDEHLERRLDDHVYARAYHMLRICEQAGIGGSDLLSLPRQSRDKLAEVLKELPRRERRRYWHEAYELHFQKRVYRALLCHQEIKKAPQENIPAKFQLVFCIDDREESMRRYFEEFGPEFETFGTAGFFAIDAEYQPYGGKAVASCPVVIKPTHRITEVAAHGHESEMKLKNTAFRFIHHWEELMGDASRTPLRGLLVSLAGLATLLPWMIKTFFPRVSVATAKMGDRLISENITEVEYLTPLDAAKAEEGGITLGYTVQEMVARVETVLKIIGLVKDFAPLVIIMGHGSHSRNNPYKSAYDCGACGGRPGKMNPRVFARMANRPDVRGALSEKGFNISENTWFVGAFHNTTSDELKIFDRDLIPKNFHPQIERLLGVAKVARGKNALERTRRFELSRAASTESAIRHVESRTHHVAEPRPEYGHATNALCVIGRRSLTRGLFFDRRSFLVSYDASIDPNAQILESILNAVVPVCMGINLEYFFSAIDNDVYGAGSKLPQNVAGLIGMMTGNTSDLRTGLPQQMIEIHEPVRLVTVLEAPATHIKAILDRNKVLRRILLNKWIITASYDPLTKVLSTMDYSGEFTPFQLEDEALLNHPLVGASLDWAQGLDGILPFASVQLH